MGLEHWLYDGFPCGEALTFTFNTYDQFMGVSVDDQTQDSIVSTDFRETAASARYISPHPCLQFKIRSSLSVSADCIPYSVRYGTNLRYAAIVVNTSINSG